MIPRLGVATLLTVSGCIGAEVIPNNNSEREIVIRTAYEYLLETNVIDGTYQYEASIPRHTPRPRPPIQPADGTESEGPKERTSWMVRFTFYDAFGEPAGEVSVPVRRFGTAANPSYEAGPLGN